MIQESCSSPLDPTPPGLADPGPVAASLWTDPALESEVVLDAIVALADVRHLPRQLAGGAKEVARQLAYADMVLLNKVWS